MKALLSKNRLRFILLLSCLASLGISVGLVIQYTYTTRSQIQFAQDYAQQQVYNAAQQLNDFLSLLKPIVHKLANELSQKKLSKKEIEQRLQQKPIEISGFAVTYAAYAFSEKEKLYSPYFLEQDGKEIMIQTGDSYDYTEPEHNWFHKPLKEGASFIGPYYAPASKTILIEYSVPFYDPDDPKKAVGIVSANQSVEHLKHVISTLYLGPTGYWFLTAKDGTFLSHPHDYLVREQKTIYDIATQQNDTNLEKAGEQATQGESVFIEYKNEINNAPSWLIAEPITTTNWSIFGVFDLAELPMDVNQRRHQLMHIISGFVIFFILAFCFCAQFFEKTAQTLWILSTGISIFMAFSVGSLWYITSKYPDFKVDLQKINNKPHLYEMLKQMTPKLMEKIEKELPKPSIFLQEEEEKSIERRYLTLELLQKLTYRFESPKHIPTGIFISHLHFTTQSQIEFVGYIWQHYIYDLHENVTRGFELPQAKTSDITEVYRKEGQYGETIMWHVQATLNQELSYKDYPFDVKNLQIQIWHKDFEKNITLIPDLDSYKLLNPRAKPGLSYNIYMPGWDIKSGAFAYKKNIYTTTFGMYDYGPFGTYQQVEKSAIPELYFDIKTQRHIMDTLISDLLPLSVIALLLFVILVMSFKQGYAILAGCASVFFGTVFAQVRFRAKIPSGQLVYFENFFLVAYGAILAVVTVSILYILGFHLGFIQYRKNLISKLLYWPLFLGALNIITLIYLY